MRKSRASSTSPAARKSFRRCYAQLRKFNCWNISIVQQYARFKQSRIRSAVFGNSRQFFIMRQNDRADLDDMGKRHRAAGSHAARDHELPAARPSDGPEVFAVHLPAHRLRRAISAARSTTSLRRRCSTAPVRAASTSTGAPASCGQSPSVVEGIIHPRQPAMKSIYSFDTCCQAAI